MELSLSLTISHQFSLQSRDHKLALPREYVVPSSVYQNPQRIKKVLFSNHLLKGLMADAKSEVPLSPEAQTAKEEMQEQLMRRIAAKVVDNAADEERQRRVKEKLSIEEKELRSKAYDKLILVQEDLVRYVNQMKVSSLQYGI